ncbi:MAG: hypothetical protein ACREO1_10665 [Arenimonas sp.]
MTEEELMAWPTPDPELLKPKSKLRFDRAKDALTSVFSGTALTKAAATSQLCPKRLNSMVRRATALAPDGKPYGYRVCVPWGTYHRVPIDEDWKVMPDIARPHSLVRLMVAQPEIRGWIEAYHHPLPKGRPPRSFERLHQKIVNELKRQDLGGYYPLNHDDKGRKALLRYLRRTRVANSIQALADGEKEKEVTSLADIFSRRLFDRFEIDAHRIDIEAKLALRMPNGGEVRRKITSLWLLAIVEADSRAVISWLLRVGKSYNNLDLSLCVARALEPWQRRTLTAGLSYAPGAGMPSGLSPEFARRRGILFAMDNAKAHHAHALEDAFCRVHDGVLNTGRPYEPETRGIIEQLFARLEIGGFRDIPGGFEPATRLGDNKIRISNFSPDDCPVQMHLLEELIEVIVTAYNAAQHPSLGHLSPLQFLQTHGAPSTWFFEAPDNVQCAAEMSSVIVPVTICGNKSNRDLPHVNYAYGRYRNSDLDNAWELIGQKLLAKVYRHDLRKILLYRTATQPLGVLRAQRPWDKTIHDETTRLMINQWARQGKLNINGVECAIAAYVTLLKATAVTSQVAVDQLARAHHLYPNYPTNTHPSKRHKEVSVPRDGWVSLDKVRDTL